MGSKLSRSSSARSNRPKSRWKRANRKHGEKLEASPDVDKFAHRINHDRENSVSNLNETYEKWNKRIEPQDVSSFNVDPPGAPSTFSAAYQMAPNDPRERTWSSPHDLTNHFYQGNGHPMGASSSIPYDVNPYMPSQLPPTLPAHSQQMLSEERPSKKVQFSRSTQPTSQQQGMPRSILTNTQSWSEQNNMMNEMTSSMIRQEPTAARQSVHRTPPTAINATSAQASVQKPIYVGIDHKATLAERGQTTTHRRHPKSSDRAGSDISSSTTNTHRTRAPHTHHQHKHADGNESSTSKSGMKSNRSFERLHAKLSGTNRPAPSASTIIANRQADQPMVNEPEIRVSRGRTNRQPHSAHMEQQTLVENEIRPSRSRGTPTNGKPQQQQQAQPQRSSGSRNNSPLRADTPRRMDNRHPNGPLMKIPISQPQRHKPSGAAPSGSTPPNNSRSRV